VDIESSGAKLEVAKLEVGKLEVAKLEVAGLDVTAANGASGRVAARLARQVEVSLAKVDLSVPQYRILMFLDDGASVASTLADHLAVSRPAVTAVVDGLVARGLVERRHHDDDRRRVGHTLTTAGRHLLAEADRSVDGRLREIAGHLGDEAQVDQVLQSLDGWRRALDDFRAARMGPAS
jgi:long-chain acyl-CoA synthetase